MQSLIKYLLARFKEGSTYRGLVLVIVAYYLKTSPEHLAEILSTGLSVNGLLGLLLPDNKPK